MEYVFETIHVPQKHSFITRELPLQSNAKVHSHKNYELNYITSGKGRRIVGDNISGFESGDLVLLGPNLPHCWELIENDKETVPSCTVTHFSEHIISSEFFKIPELESLVDLLKQANRGISFKVKNNKKIKQAFNKMAKSSNLEYYIEFLKIFSLLINNEKKEILSNPRNITTPFSKNLEKINKVYEYVFLNIQEGIKLEAAAAELNMAPSSFCRFFKSKTNITFMDYVKSVRIGIAAKLLAETNKQITNICYESGYNNLANFNHFFKNTMGKTPSEYRNSLRK